MEITNLSDAEFKTLVLRMLRELTEYGNNIKEEMEVILSEIKKNLQGTNREGKEAGIPNNDLEHKEEVNIQSEQNEETRIQKKQGECKKTLGHLQTCQHLNHRGARKRRTRARI